MHAWDYVLAIGFFFVLAFTVVIDILLIRELIQKRRNKQDPPRSSGG